MQSTDNAVRAALDDIGRQLRQPVPRIRPSTLAARLARASELERERAGATIPRQSS